jgi:hypothetical protein
MGSTKPFLHFVVPGDLLKRIDDFRFKYRFPSRSAAILWMVKAVLDKKLAPKVD